MQSEKITVKYLSEYSVTMEHAFEFDVTAEGDQIVVEKEINLPISIKINYLEVQTISTCNNRLHGATIAINENPILSTTITDCTKLVITQLITVNSGNLKIRLIVNNFEAGEIVKGNGRVEYDIVFLPFAQSNNSFTIKDILISKHLRFVN